MTQTDLEQHLDPPPGERPSSQSTPQPSGPAAPQGADWVHDEQICWLREARSLLGSVQHDLGQVGSMRDRPLGDGPQLQVLERLLWLADGELELLTAARHAELKPDHAGWRRSAVRRRWMDARQEDRSRATRSTLQSRFLPVIRFGLVAAMTAVIAVAVTGLLVLAARFVWVQLWSVYSGTP